MRKVTLNGNGMGNLFRLLSIGACCLLSGFYAGAQASYTDSLKALLDKQMPDTSRLEILLKLGDKEAYADDTPALAYSGQAFAIAKQHRLYGKMGEAMGYMATVYFYRDEYDSAMSYYHKGIAYFRQDTSTDSRLSIATMQSNMADVYAVQGEWERAVKTYLHTIDTLKRYSPQNHNAIGNTYLAIGSVYKNMQQPEKALSYGQLAVPELEQDPAGPVATELARLFVVRSMFPLRRYAEARRQLDSIKSVADKLQSPALYVSLYGTTGSYYDHMGQLKESVAAYKKAMSYAIKAGDKYSQVSALIQMGLISMDKEVGDYSGGIKYLEDALQLTRTLGDKHREASMLRNLGFGESKSGNLQKSVDYYQQYIQLNDSLNSTEMQKQINEIENKYQAKQKQDSILVLQKNSQIQSLQLQKKRNLNNILLAGFALLAIIGFLIYRNIRHRHHILKQNEMLHVERIRELEKERQLVAMQSVIKGQEEERSRLARDLHDGVGGLLSGVKLSLSTMKGNVFLSEENARSINNVLVQLDQSITELRRVSHNMMPESLIKFGLKEALVNYCENINLSGGIKVQLQTYGMESRMEQSTEIILYRIIQELLNNVIKHAEAENVLIQLIKKEDRFSLTVEDDGKGFDTNEIQKEGAGLANIRARVDYLGGTIDFRSAQGEGTSVNIEGKDKTGEE